MNDSPTALDFALAIAEPGKEAQLIGRTNAGAGRAYVQAAVQRCLAVGGLTYAVSPREGLLACDVDAGGNPPPEHWTPQLEAAARSIGCALVWVASGGAGCRHLWIIAPVGWDTDALYDHLRSRSVAPPRQLRRGQPTRPPLAPHRLGGVATPIDPADPAQALARFQRRPGQIDLADKWHKLMREGDTTGKYKTPEGKPSRSALTTALATAWVNAGLGLDSFRVTLCQPHNAAGEKYREKLRQSTHAADRWLTDLWKGQLAHVREHPPDPNAIRQRLEDSLPAIDGMDWSYRGGDTDRRLLKALVDIGATAGTTEPAASQRRLAIDLAIGPGTVRQSLKRLSARGHLTIIPSDDYRQAYAYRLHLETYLPSPNRPLTTGGGTRGLIGGVSVTFGDVFTNGSGLGLSALDTYQALSPDQWLTTESVLQRRPSGATARAVREHLKALKRQGYAERNRPKGHKWRRLDRDEAHHRAVAERLGVHGKQNRRKDRHAIEQEQHQQRLGSRGLRRPAE